MSELFPRWGDDAGQEAVGRVEVDLPAGVVRLAGELSTEVESVLLAVHSRVVATLCGEQQVNVRCAAGTVPVAVGTGTWRRLIDEAASARRVPDGTNALTAVSVDGSIDGNPAGGELLTVEFTVTEDHTRCTVRHRSAEVGAEQARRIAGYHLVALEHLLADSDAVHHPLSLVAGDELREQIHDFAGPVVALPDEPVHETVQRRAAGHPDRIALICGEAAVTYAELNRRANQVAWQLLDAGLRPEDTVAVVAVRGVEWACGVLGVLKAGGVYLPVEPEFPGERIRTMLEQSGCGLALVDEQAPGLPWLPEQAVLRLDHDQGPARDRDPDVPVRLDQLAYVYFTSGSTGRPKGALCEHAGMVNHVLAKIEDFDMGEGAVVAQVAPQCFDISLWQLVSAWVLGGRTVIVEQAAVHDVAAFTDTVRGQSVEILQVVPSYLDVLLADQEASVTAGTAFPALRRVSVTGEPVKSGLLRRWFARFPEVPVVNAYGLTETSDDTNHAVLTEAPTGRVPVGPPVRNVRIYLVDEQLRPVPLGSVGEIVFAGVCVGRGYINDTERTNRAYLADPYFPGQRMYRSGDFGRWLPDGTLDFLGRRDAQVKIRGFRVELGDVENALAAIDGVGQCAVVVAAGGDGQDVLAGFYTTTVDLTPDVVRDRLGAALPAYMVPTVLQDREALPLTDNGKIDKLALTRSVSTVQDGPGGHTGPATLTPAQLRLRGAWCDVLGIAPSYVRPGSHFFELGGTSLLAIRLSIALDRALTLGDVVSTPVFEDLARLLESRADEPESDAVGTGGKSA